MTPSCKCQRRGAVATAIAICLCCQWLDNEWAGRVCASIWVNILSFPAPSVFRFSIDTLSKIPGILRHTFVCGSYIDTPDSRCFKLILWFLHLLPSFIIIRLSPSISTSANITNLSRWGNQRCTCCPCHLPPLLLLMTPQTKFGPLFCSFIILCDSSFITY